LRRECEFSFGRTRDTIDQDNLELGHAAQQGHGLLDDGWWWRHGSEAEAIEGIRYLGIQAGRGEQTGIEPPAPIQQRLALGAERAIDEPPYHDGGIHDKGGREPLLPGAGVPRLDELFYRIGATCRINATFAQSLVNGGHAGTESAYFLRGKRPRQTRVCKGWIVRCIHKSVHILYKYTTVAQRRGSTRSRANKRSNVIALRRRRLDRPVRCDRWRRCASRADRKAAAEA